MRNRFFPCTGVWNSLVCRVSSARRCGIEAHGEAAIVRKQPALASALRLAATRLVATVARTRNENRCYRSPTHLAIAQTARHPSVDITDTTPAHIAAALRPDRHHTRGLNTFILGWRLYEVHTLQPFCMNSSRPGRPMSANYSLRHGEYYPPCRKLSGVAWQSPQQEEFAYKAMRVVCTSRRHQRVKVVESPARARDGWRCRQHG